MHDTMQSPFSVIYLTPYKRSRKSTNPDPKHTNHPSDIYNHPPIHPQLKVPFTFSKIHTEKSGRILILNCFSSFFFYTLLFSLSFSYVRTHPFQRGRAGGRTDNYTIPKYPIPHTSKSSSPSRGFDLFTSLLSTTCLRRFPRLPSVRPFVPIYHIIRIGPSSALSLPSHPVPAFYAAVKETHLEYVSI